MTVVGWATRVMWPTMSVFFVGYCCFTSMAALLFSVAVLPSEAMASSLGELCTMVAWLRSVFTVAGFPPLPFFVLLVAKLSQTMFMFVTTLPFTLTFLLLAKAHVTANALD